MLWMGFFAVDCRTENENIEWTNRAWTIFKVL